MKPNITNLGKDAAARIVTPGSGTAASKSRIDKTSARELIYKPSQGPGAYSLVLLRHPQTKKLHVVPAGFNFYITEGKEMTAFTLGLGGDLIWTQSYFQAGDAAADENSALAQLQTTVDDRQIHERIRNSSHIDLQAAAPPGFFTAWAPEGVSMQPGQAEIIGIDIAGDLLRLDLKSEKEKHSGSFWISLKKKALVRSNVDNQEMNFAPGRPFAVPAN